MAAIKRDKEVNLIDNIPTTKEEVAERYLFLKTLLLIAVAALIARSFYLQIVHGNDLHLQAEDNRVSFVPRLAPRGVIYDIQGRQMVENIASTDVVLDPLVMPSEEHEASLVDGLTKHLDMKPNEIQEALSQARRKTRVVILDKALEHDLVIKLEGALHELPGVRLVSSSVRNYLYPYSMSHVLGYTGLVSEDELEGNEYLIMNDTTGKAGVEKWYDEALRGRSGASYIEVNAAGQPQKELRVDDPIPGNDLQLTVDAQLQDFIFNLLAENETIGSVIALDPQSGAVRALVSYPSYDPNAFSQPGELNKSSEFFEDSRQPLFNRSIGGTYPPGSTIKPLIAAVGLQEEIITKNTSVLSTGGISIGIWSFPDWKAGGHGQTNVIKAIAESVNTFFYLLSGGDEGTKGLGVEKITKYLGYFSWGKETGIDLPNEASGLLPSPRWKEETKNERWYIGDTYHLGIGQGDVLVTPLQVAVGTAAIANGSMVYQPYVVSEGSNQTRRDSSKSVKGTKLPIKKSHIRTVQEGMRQAVLAGSARRLSKLPLAVAGKTGTAQFGEEEDDTHAWFTSYGPVENAELVVTVLLEKGGKGDVNAVPIAQEVWQWWYEHKDK
jgi:penicillin-binding protein 2